MDVVIERREREGSSEVRVGVRSAATGLALFACAGRGLAGAALATVEVQGWCGRHGHRVVVERTVREQRVPRRARRAA